MTYIGGLDRKGRVVVKEDGDTFLLVGEQSGMAVMWAAWYAEYLNTDSAPPWPVRNLQVFRTDDYALFVFDGLPVGIIDWSVERWWWHNVSVGGLLSTSEHVSVDPDQEFAFQQERIAVVRSDPSVIDVLQAEFDGRVRVFRDDTFDMAMMFGRSKARRIGVYRRTQEL